LKTKVQQQHKTLEDDLEFLLEVKILF